jgi:hypothetical protein
MKRPLWRWVGLIALGLSVCFLIPVEASAPAIVFDNNVATPAMNVACSDGGDIWANSYGTCDDVDCCGGPGRDLCEPFTV